MMLHTPLSKAIRTTPFHLQRLESLGITSVSDFLLYFPRAYTDEREIRNIADVRVNEKNTISGVIKEIQLDRRLRRFLIVTALMEDRTGALEVVWFNQPHLLRLLHKGDSILLSGKLKFYKRRLVLSSPSYELLRKEQRHMARIVPVYHETDLKAPKRIKGKISSKWIREKLFLLLPFADEFPEYLPEEIRRANGFLPYGEAIRHVHFPQNEKMLTAARKRLAFDELFLLQLAAEKRRFEWRKIAENERKQIPANFDLIRQFVQTLPFKLTDAQRKAIFEILKDMEKPYPMSRLLEGEVGSGKTIVAAAAILNTVKTGFQTCFMAPTEILAKQHFETLSKFLRPFDITITLIVGSTREAEKKMIIESLKNGELPVVVGTHALIQESIGFHKLGLAVIDEQHRFGVKQRERLKSFGSPHLLSLTATPIPRTLALTMYGDQDLSLLDEMPKGRQKIVTRIVPEEKREAAYRWIESQIGEGRQTFIICPLIEESESLQMKAAKVEFERLAREVFPKLRLGLLHGKLGAKEKEKIMQQFVRNEIQILVTTAVVEVGIDVPNATIIIIEGAERFGLAQLHQFRGRVGRGVYQSYCFLFPSLDTPETFKRLKALEHYSSGFKLAEIDLQIRGPGEVYGIRQSGLPDLKMASLTDLETIKKARDAATMIIEEDPELKKYPLLLEKINEQENVAIDY